MHRTIACVIGQPATWAIWMVVCAGCGNGNSKFARYVPNGGTAREALVAALTAWQNGEQPGKIDSVSPVVHAVDSHWQGGNRLQSYEVIAEQPGEGPKRFSVRLTLVGSDHPQEVTYFVLGQDPLWVFRDTDFARVSQWEHGHGDPNK